MAPFFWQKSTSTNTESDAKSTATAQEPSERQERGVRHSATAWTTHSDSSKAEGRGDRRAATAETVHGNPVTRSAARLSSACSSSTTSPSSRSSQESTPMAATTATRHAFTPAEKADLASHVIRPNAYSATTAGLLCSTQLSKCLVPAIPDAAAVMSGPATNGNAGSPPSINSCPAVEPKREDVSDCAQKEKTQPVATEPEKKRAEEQTSNTTGGGGVNFSFVVCSEASTSADSSNGNNAGSTFRNQTITSLNLPHGARLIDCKLTNCSGSGLRVTDCSFSGCSFANSRVTDCRFSSSALSGCRVQDCVFSNCQVFNSRVEGCRHSGSTVTDASGIQGGGGGGAVFSVVEIPPEDAAKVVGFVLTVTFVLMGVILVFGKYDAARGVYTLG